ncbi:hypothetical protein OH76DRAFT_1348475, partial [Lentinus brumalis]
MQKSRLTTEPRKISKWNAYVSKEMKKFNEGLSGDAQERECVSDGYIKILSEQWRKMTEEERDEAVADIIIDLEERRENRRIAIPNEASAAFNDTRATLALVQRELEYLHGRTDTDVLFIAVRSKLDYYNQPYVFYSNDRVAEFWETLGKKNLPDLALAMEGYCISGMDGLAKNHRDELLEAKQRVAALILRKLRETSTRGEIARMYYVNFEEHITLKYGIILVHWPLQKFAAPGSFSSILLLNMLESGFEKGTTRFESLSDAEWTAW